MNVDQITSFLLSISIMLFAAKFLGEIFNKIKQPAIIGEILAGIILGPTILGYFSPSFFNYLFPFTTELKYAFDGITNIAVIMLLLVSGLEVDLSLVIKQGKPAFYTGVLGIIIPFALGFLTAYYAPEWYGGTSTNMRMAFALFLGTAMSISALPVIAKTLIDLNLFKTKIGFVIIASAMFDDIVGWLIFSLIIGLISKGESHFSFPHTLGMLLFFFFFTLIIGRKIINRIIPVIQNKLSFPGSILNFIFILGFSCAAFTEYIGVHAIFGAFIVGIAIGDSAHLKEETRETIQQFVTNIFAPLFFVSIGLKVNFVTSFNPMLVLIITAIAFIGKVVGCGLGARIGGFSKNESLAIGFGKNSRGAMEIILGLIALEAGLINQELYVALVSMALITSITSAPLINYFLRFKRNLFVNHISASSIKFINASTKYEAIQLLINEGLNAKFDKSRIYDAVIEKENQSTSGISNFLAIPHARVNIDKPTIVVGINKDGLDFNSFDDINSRVIVLLLTPTEKAELQLELLADIVKKFKDKYKVEELLKKKSSSEIYKFLKRM